MERPANPAPLLATLQELQQQIVQPQIADWLESEREREDFHQRLAHHYSLPGGPASVNSHYPRSITSSMAKTQIHQASNTSAYAPSLCSYHPSEATLTDSSISTALVSTFSAGVPLLEEVDGILQRPTNNIQQPLFECTFWFLSCPCIFSDLEEWSTHCASHFRGEEPPKSVTCPLCDEFSYTCRSGWASWQQRTQHLAWHHLQGQTLRTSRPDFHLFQHLWQKRLIDDADLKELKGGNHNLTKPPTNYTRTEGRRDRPGRGQRIQHVGAAGPARRRG